MKCLPIALNSGNTWPKNGKLIPNKKIIISILKPLMPGIDKNKFIKTLEDSIYQEIDKINLS